MLRFVFCVPFLPASSRCVAMHVVSEMVSCAAWLVVDDERVATSV